VDRGDISTAIGFGFGEGCEGGGKVGAQIGRWLGR
jgi:hypothetical protein